MPWPLFTPGKDPVPIVQEAGWAPGLVWTGTQNLGPTAQTTRPTSIRNLYDPHISLSLSHGHRKKEYFYQQDEHYAAKFVVRSKASIQTITKIFMQLPKKCIPYTFRTQKRHHLRSCAEVLTLYQTSTIIR
jgi:hypothetical protein